MIIYRKQLRSQKRRRRRWSELWVVATHARTRERESGRKSTVRIPAPSKKLCLEKLASLQPTFIPYSGFQMVAFNLLIQWDLWQLLTALFWFSSSIITWARRRSSKKPSWFHWRGLDQLHSDTSHIDASAELWQGESEGKDVCDTSSVIAPLYNSLA